MHILTGAEMREADRRAIEEVGVSGRVLMESAGRGVAGVMEEHIADLAEHNILIVCGKGNNGGDGLVLLRTLVGLGYDAWAIVLSPLEQLAPDALDNLQSALKLRLPVDSVTTEDAWTDTLAEIWTADVIVDAILGTGLTREPHGLPRRAIEDLDAMEAFKVAVDVPSGLSADSGSVPGAVLSADLTVALAAPKVCHFISPACEHCGELEVVEIGIPPEFLENGLIPGSPGLESIETEPLAALWPPRTADAHKGDFGHLLVVAGSVGKTGAAVMAAEAALRVGAGLVTVASATSAIPMMAPRLPEVMWEPLPETASGALAFAALERIQELIAERTALALGPGLGRDDETVRLVRKLVAECGAPTVVDADGLNSLGVLKDDEDAIPRDQPLALTPHPGEAARLLGTTAAAVQQDRLRAARSLATGARTHVLLKGFRSLICDPEGHTVVNLTGNPGLATAGSGDVLSGIVGGLLAQGVSVDAALVLGAHTHGLAGDLAAAELGETSLIATDVIRKLPEAIRTLGAD